MQIIHIITRAIAKHNITMSNNAKHATSKSTSFEDKIRQYASFFDGRKDFSDDVESAFNGLYHDDFIGSDSIGIEINKETKKRLDMERLAAGVKVTSVACTRIDWNKALVNFFVHSILSQLRTRR